MIFHLTLWKQPIWLLGFKFWLYTRIVANPTQETICFRYQFGFKVWIYHWSIYLEAGQFKFFSFVGETLADLESAARPQILANLARFVQSKTKFQCQFNKFTIQSIHHFPHSMIQCISSNARASWSILTSIFFSPPALPGRNLNVFTCKNNVNVSNMKSLQQIQFCRSPVTYFFLRWVRVPGTNRWK